MREKILKKLAGSASQKPLTLDDLRILADEDTAPLYDALEKLYSEHVINRVSGFKNGKQYIGYWITGAVQTAAPFSITGKQLQPRPQIIQRSETKATAAAIQTQIESTGIPEVKAKTSISDSSNETTEVNMSKQPSLIRGLTSELTKEILNQVILKPGISKENLRDFAVAKFPESTLKQINKSIWNLINQSKRIHMDGNGPDATIHMVSQKERPIKAKAAAKLITGSAARKIARTVNKKSAQDIQSHHRLDDDFDFVFGVRKDGCVFISKNSHSITLSRSEIQSISNHISQY